MNAKEAFERSKAAKEATRLFEVVQKYIAGAADCGFTTMTFDLTAYRHHEIEYAKKELHRLGFIVDVRDGGRNDSYFCISWERNAST